MNGRFLWHGLTTVAGDAIQFSIANIDQCLHLLEHLGDMFANQPVDQGSINGLICGDRGCEYLLGTQEFNKPFFHPSIGREPNMVEFVLDQSIDPEAFGWRWIAKPDLVRRFPLNACEVRADSDRATRGIFLPLGAATIAEVDFVVRLGVQSAPIGDVVGG